MGAEPLSVLIVEDERDVREPLALYLRSEGLDVRTAANGKVALDELSQRPVDVILSDVRMPVMSGLELLKRVRSQYPDIRVLILTAFGTGESAAAAVSMGAQEYILKPVVFEDIYQKILRVCRRDQRTAVAAARGTIAPGLASLDAIRGQSPQIEELKAIIQRVARAGSSALIVGESGTGKELVARALHNLSERHSSPYMAVNCAAIPEHLLESEFFGHAKGSFTGAIADKKGLFESAAKGTLFLDEIADLPIHMQAKLLRALEEKEVTPVGKTQPVPVQATILAACSRNLKEAVDTGHFRSDLFFRINVIEIDVPPLRERMGDIRYLAEYFLEETGTRLRVTANRFAKDALDAITRYAWPGNVRELRNVIERAVVLAPGETIEVTHLPSHVRSARGQRQTLKSAVAGFERDLILRTLRSCGDDKKRAAEMLGMGLSSLYRKLEEIAEK